MDLLSHQMLHTAVTEGPCFLKSGPHGRIDSANAAFCDLLGYSESELRQIGWVKLSVDDEDLTSDQENVTELIAGKIRIYKQWKAYRHRFGQPVPGQLMVIRFPQSDEAIDCCLCWFIPLVNGTKAALDLVTKYIQDHTQITQETCKAVNDMVAQLTIKPQQTRTRRLGDALLDWAEENPTKAWAALGVMATVFATMPQVATRYMLPAQPVRIEMPANPSHEEKRLINAIRQKSSEDVVSTPKATGIEFQAYRPVFREYTTAAGHRVSFHRNGDITLSRGGAGSAGDLSDSGCRRGGEGCTEHQDQSGVDYTRGAPRCVGNVHEF